MSYIAKEDLELSDKINNFVIEKYKKDSAMKHAAICDFIARIKTSSFDNKSQIILEMRKALTENGLSASGFCE
jgi:hypothetical protein